MKAQAFKSIFFKMSRKRKISMPTYVIVEKREFEKLFETVAIDGNDLTAINVKTSSKAKNNSRLRLHKSENSSKRRKKEKKGCSTEVARRESDSTEHKTKDFENDSVPEVESTKSELDSRHSGNTSSGSSDQGNGAFELGYSSATESESE